MNGKDLLSINEAFANATSNVTTDQPAKKDEVVTENDCEHCNGTGKHDKEDCTKCDGTGVLKEKSTDSDSYVDNIMSDYENSLSKNYGVKNVKEKSTDQRPKDEVKADEKSKDVGGAKEDLQEPVEADAKEEEKKPKKKEKRLKESINNCSKGNIMSEDKSIFDKLYESVMGEDDDFELGIPGDDDGLDVGDDAGDEGGEEITVTLSPEQVDVLKTIVDQLGGDDEEDLGDELDGDDPLADTSGFEDGVQEDTTQTGDGKKPGTDPSDGGGKATDPAADSLGGKTSGDGAVPVTDEEGTTQTSDGKKTGVAKNSGKPGKLAV